jgi:hypothetical protein
MTTRTRPSDAEVNRGLRGLPPTLRVEPALQYLDACPGLEHLCGRRLEGALDPEDLAGVIRRARHGKSIVVYS